MKQILHILILCLVMALPPEAFAKMLDIQTVTSPKHKITAWLVEDHTNPVLSIKFAFKGAGAAQDEQTSQGLARLLSNTLDEGAGNKSSEAFQAALDDRSIALHFSATRDNFYGTLKTLTRHQEASFALLRDALTRPTFPADAVTRMVEANKSRIRSQMHRPGWIAARLINDITYGKDHPYRLNSGGTLSTLDAITADDLKAFHAKALAKDNLIVSVSGAITAKQLAPILDKIFGDLPKTHKLPPIPPAKQHNKGRIFVYEQDIPQTTIHMVHPGIDQTDPTYHHAQIMNFTLGASGFGSRLMHALREERGLTYGIYTHLFSLDQFKGLMLTTSTKNSSVQEALNLIHQQWNAVKENGITAEELNTAKTYLLGQLPLTLTSTDAIAELILSLQAKNLPIEYLDHRENVIRNASLSDIKNMANTLLSTQDLTTVLVGKPQVSDDVTRIKNLPNVE